MNSLPISHKLARYIAVISASVLAIMLAVWVRGDPVENLQTDWLAFDNAGDRVRSGETVYRPHSSDSEPFPYFYPPFALWLALPLAAFGFWGSYIFSAVMTLTANVVGVRWLGRDAGSTIDRSTGAIVAIASGSTISSTLIGQYSGLYVLAFGAALVAYRRDAHLLAGVLLAFLWIKPNIAVAVPVVLIWSRSWRSLRGFVAGSGVLVLLSLPFGFDRWTGFADNVRSIAELQEQGAVPIDKMVTVLSMVQTQFELDSSTNAAAFVWLPIAAILGVCILTLWTPARLAESPLRAFGALCLFVVAANPRMYFYDGALVAAGMYGVWLSAKTLSSGSVQRVLSVLAAIAWIGLWGSVYIPANMLVGPAAAISLVLVAIASRSSAAQMRPVSDIKNNEFRSAPPGHSTELAA